MENTIKIRITIHPCEEWFADLLTSELAELGFDSFVETGDGFEAYIPGNRYNENVLNSFLHCQDENFLIEWHREILPYQNWNEIWERNYFKPLVIKNRVLVRAPFHTVTRDYPLTIVIEPKMAFGTGNHETTTLMIEAMLDLDIKDKKVLDMGCGTGILAILASKLGASGITAVDIDPCSFEVVSENIIINNTANVKPLTGDAKILGEEYFNLILVNIQKNVILNDMGKYSSVLLPGGTVLFSGFFERDLPDVKKKAESCGLHFTASKAKSNWIVSTFSR